jgi:uncharacterized membrane protein YcjF (UPF0283 family)
MTLVVIVVVVVVVVVIVVVVVVEERFRLARTCSRLDLREGQRDRNRRHICP